MEHCAAPLEWPLPGNHAAAFGLATRARGFREANWRMCEADVFECWSHPNCRATYYSACAGAHRWWAYQRPYVPDGRGPFVVGLPAGKEMSPMVDCEATIAPRQLLLEES